MIAVPLSDENGCDDLIYNDDDFSILTFNLNIGGMALNKEYNHNDIKNLHSPDFFTSVEQKILKTSPNIVTIVTLGDLEKETYFHSDFLPMIMTNLKYKLLVRDKNTKNEKIGILRISIYIKLNDKSIKNIQLNKKILSNNNIYVSDKCTSLVFYVQTLIGMIAFIGISTFDKNITQIENNFIKDKLIDYIFILGDLPNINRLEDYYQISNNPDINDFFQHGNVFYCYKINRIEKIHSKIIKDNDLGLKTKCNLGLLGFYNIKVQKIKSINFLNEYKFPKYCLNDKLTESEILKLKNDDNFLYDIQISHNAIFFLAYDNIFINIDDDKPYYKDKFFLQRKNSDFNGYWIIENNKNITYNNFIKLNTYENEIKTFSSGYEHLIFLTKSGEIYGIGNNKYGQLGVKSQKNYYFFRKIELDEVLIIKCGSFHTIIYTKKGLYAFGNNLFGQLGLKDKYLTYVFNITKININLKIKNISCGDEHTVLLTYDNDIYVFGSNKNGQLGFDNYDEDIIYPKLLNIPNISIILDIYCGDNYTVINTIEGLYILYKNDQLKNIHELKCRNILNISCCKDYILVLSDSGLFGVKLDNLILININIKNVNSIYCKFNKSIIQTRKNNNRVYIFHDILNNQTIEHLWDVI